MTYDYKCERCDHEFEVEQKITEAPLTKCPECGEDALKRQITKAPGFELLGKGWARDGY